MTTSHRTGPIVVTAATGKTGRRVLDLLRRQGIETRVASRATGFAWEDPRSWPALLSGAHAVYTAFAPDLAIPRAAAILTEFARAAKAHGVERLVLLSGRGEEGAMDSEAGVRSVLPDATVIRCSFFAQNFTEGAFADAIAHGEVALPTIDVPEPFVDADDVAEVAARVLVEDGHGGRTYELTGSELVTFAEAVALIGRQTGRDIACVTVPVDPWRAELAAHGTPDEVVDLLAHLFTELMDGRNSSLGDGVERVLGRRPRSFTEFVGREFPAAVRA